MTEATVRRQLVLDEPGTGVGAVPSSTSPTRVSEGAQTAPAPTALRCRWPEATMRTSAPETAAVERGHGRRSGISQPSVRITTDRLVDEDEHRLIRAHRGGEPLVVLGRAEQVRVGADEPPPGEIDDEPVAAPRGPKRRQPSCPVGVLAVEADVVVPRDEQQWNRQFVVEATGEGAVGVVVGILVDDVAGVHHQIGWVGPQPAGERRPLRRVHRSGGRGGCR